MEKQKLISTLTDIINNFSFDDKGFIEELSIEHRTLQQSFTRLVFKWIEFCASDKYPFDERNIATHNICKEMVDAFSKYKEEQFPLHWKGVKPSDFLPLV